MKTVWFENKNVMLIDQRKIPEKIEIYIAKDYEEVAYAIEAMIVRGAPAIGVTAAYGMAQAVLQNKELDKVFERLKKTRPTAYDLFYALNYMKENLKNKDPIMLAEEYAASITLKCEKIGVYGNELIKQNDKILTHCNAGALAVVDWGTALAPMRVAKKMNKNIFVWVDETRPRLQGAKLTSWELIQEDIAHKVIADNVSGSLMFRKQVDLVIVGADRIAKNGDFANKIGTYEKAVLAKENHIPFYVAAPISTIDLSINDGSQIPIEEREENEVRFVGTCKIVDDRAAVYNPAFDVTPAKYVTGFITEYGIIKPNKIKDLKI
jgi:translation initiation factor eIF-2B subunit alpha/methylthioribose-1-phosphate isomerase